MPFLTHSPTVGHYFITMIYIVLQTVLLLGISSSGFAAGFADPAAVDQGSHILLEQNWTERDRQWFYHKNQGSRLLPYEIFLHLEQADNKRLLREPINMLRLGFIPGVKSTENPDVLPIGFSRDRDHLGLTCAACHTQLIEYDGQYIRIDGGQAMIDFQQMMKEIEVSMRATLEQEEKFSRFQQRMLGDAPDADEVSDLRTDLQSAYDHHVEFNQRNATRIPYGHSRLDAFGAILNKGLLLTGEKDNYIEPNAPTSYPYLWDTPQHDYVEWNGSQSNSHVGALARNVGEVIGVFGELDTEPAKRFFFFDAGYESSIKARGLRQLEKHIALLHSPLWPEIFPPIDTEKAMAGSQIYEKYCVSCHQGIDRTDDKRLIKVRMSSLDEIGTDPLMATNVLTLEGKTGVFAGMPRYYAAGEPLGERAPALYVVNTLMGGVLKNNLLQAYLAKKDTARLGHPEDIHHPPKYLDGEILPMGEEISEKALMAYKARPMNGVWSSAPFLHNGSVPTLYDLLLPANERPQYFCIASWEYDPVKVGYVSEYSTDVPCIDTNTEGNSNAGHEYGTGAGYDGLPRLNTEEIFALIEYMKTL